MKVGIDSYCYHRFFGEVYPQHPQPDRRMTLEDFLRRAHELGVDGVSLESCFLPEFSAGYLAHVKQILDGYGLDRVYAWGHPDGLEGGTNVVHEALGVGVTENGAGVHRRLLQRIWLRRTALRSRADTTAASSTRWVWYASSKSGRGTTGGPPPTAVTMSATWLTKVWS